MKKAIVTIVTLFAMLTVCVAQTADKIATVDLETVIRCHPETANNKKALEDMRVKYEKQRDDERTKLDKLQENFLMAQDKANDPASSEQVRETSANTAKEIYNDLRKRDEEFRALVVRLQRSLTDMEMNLFEGTMKEVDAKLEKIVKAKGITLVIDKSAGRMGAPVPVVLYASPSIDLTEELVKAMGGKLDSEASAPADNKKKK